MLEFFRRLMDQREDRSFQYREEFFTGHSGAFRQNTGGEPNAATCALVAEILFDQAEYWAQKSMESQRRDRTIIDGQLIDSMISGR